MPREELRSVLIKEQHNVASNGKDYPLRLPLIMHEYVILWVRREVTRATVSQGTRRSVGGSLPVRAQLVTAACEATGTMQPAARQSRTARGDEDDAVARHQELGLEGMVNVSELPINAVSTNKPPGDTCWLEPKGTESGRPVPQSGRTDSGLSR
jgi:hypothetical protein